MFLQREEDGTFIEMERKPACVLNKKGFDDSLGSVLQDSLLFFSVFFSLSSSLMPFLRYCGACWFPPGSQQW